MGRLGALVSAVYVGLPTPVAKLVRTETGHVVTSLVPRYHHAALWAFPKTKPPLNPSSDHPIARACMLELKTFLAVLLLAGIALELCGSGLVISIAIRLRTESDGGIGKYLAIPDDFGVFVLPLL
jgi:hypothetical protein